jgi:hypothetical protein
MAFFLKEQYSVSALFIDYGPALRVRVRRLVKYAGLAGSTFTSSLRGVRPGFISSSGRVHHGVGTHSCCFLPSCTCNMKSDSSLWASIQASYVDCSSFTQRVQDTFDLYTSGKVL